MSLSQIHYKLQTDRTVQVLLLFKPHKGALFVEDVALLAREEHHVFSYIKVFGAHFAYSEVFLLHL